VSQRIPVPVYLKHVEIFSGFGHKNLGLDPLRIHEKHLDPDQINPDPLHYSVLVISHVRDQSQNMLHKN